MQPLSEGGLNFFVDYIRDQTLHVGHSMGQVRAEQDLLIGYSDGAVTECVPHTAIQYVRKARCAGLNPV